MEDRISSLLLSPRHFLFTPGLLRPSLLLGVMALLPGLGQGQSVIYTLDGEAFDDNFGFTVSDAGDVNQDGYADIIVGARSWSADPLGPDSTLNNGDDVRGNGRAYVYSGRNGAALHTFDGENGGMSYICTANGCWWPSGDNFGLSVSGGGDENGDGFPDILVGADQWDADPIGPDGTPLTGDENTQNGRVYLFSGKSGSLIRTHEGHHNLEFFGFSVDFIGDLQGNGKDSYMAGAQFFTIDPDGTIGTPDDVKWIGRAYVFSGKGGALLRTHTGLIASDHFAVSLSGVGDVNLDAIPDYAVGSTGYDGGPDGILGNGDDILTGGRVVVFSGKDGSTIWMRSGDVSFGGMGWDEAGVGDVNSDGHADVVASAPYYDVDPDGTPGNGDDRNYAGRVYVYSGKNSSTLFAFDGEAEWDNLGRSVAGAGDGNGDGTPDILAGAYQPAPWSTGAGRLYLYSGKSGATLWTMDGGATSDYLGHASSGVGDTNLDGIPDIVVGAFQWDDPTELGPDGTAGSGDENGEHGRAYVVSGSPMSLTADTHQMSVSTASSQNLSIDAGVANSLSAYWLFTNFAASGNSPGVTMAPGVVIPLNSDVLTSFVISLTQLGGGGPTFVGWKGSLNFSGKASASLNTFGVVPVTLGITLNHAALIYAPNGCGVGCDTFHLATNWVPMTTVP